MPLALHAVTEYDSAAEWCATRGLSGAIGTALPPLLSVEVVEAINEDPEAFETRVRAHAYALAMSKIDEPLEHLTCAMTHDCSEPISHIDKKGYVYCAKHGKARRLSGISCRQLTSKERRTLESGGAVRSY